MTQVYYLPPCPGDVSDEVAQLCHKAGVPFVEITRIFEMYKYIDQGGIVVVSIPAPQLAIISRYMAELLEDLPTVVLAAPGCNYSAEWMMHAHALATTDWKTLQQQLIKSGLLASTTKQAQDRSVSMVPGPLPGIEKPDIPQSKPKAPVVSGPKFVSKIVDTKEDTDE